jgi:hypothetical protein
MKSLLQSLKSKIFLFLFFSLSFIVLSSNEVVAQDDAAVAFDTVTVGDEIFENTTAG